MIDILDQFESWLDKSAPFALATVIKTWRSAPRTEGSSMIISEAGAMVGSVSGGCVESAVVQEAVKMISNDSKPGRLSFGVVDEEAWSVGLSCGGQIDIWLELVTDNQLWRELITQVRSDTGCLLVTGLEEKNEIKGLYINGNLEGITEDQALLEACKEAYDQHKTQIFEDYFLQVFPARSRLIIIGAAHVSLDLIKLANLYNFETIVIDPRGIFTDKQRFDIPPDKLITDWPAEVLPNLPLDADTYVVVLTHDPKIDDQALQIVLKSGVAYVGALGSRKTHAKRTLRLKESGLNDQEIDRIHGPVGLDINARQPAEIALSIMAEVIATRNRFL
ncbi:MAG: xanthine dehydrogenase accessory factor [Cyclobacteriaceae bacterium]|nr:MAG: xanthine dehydrogenase accessory factor [Cyclobacteriaceae bacterium]